MRRIASKYLYTLTSTEPVRNGFVEVEKTMDRILEGFKNEFGAILR